MLVGQAFGPGHGRGPIRKLMAVNDDGAPYSGGLAELLRDASYSRRGYRSYFRRLLWLKFGHLLLQELKAWLARHAIDLKPPLHGQGLACVRVIERPGSAFRHLPYQGFPRFLVPQIEA